MRDRLVIANFGFNVREKHGKPPLPYRNCAS